MRSKVLIAVSILVATLVLLGLISFINRASYQDNWKKRTTPLPEETRRRLCSSFQMSSQASLCNGKEDVYALDFMPIIGDTFRPYEAYGIERSEAATYDEVEKKIGTFKYACEPVETTGDGLTFFTCSYDLRGDREFVMTIMYTYPEKSVMRIMSTSRFDDY